jgi:hypothetical protein
LGGGGIRHSALSTSRRRDRETTMMMPIRNFVTGFMPLIEPALRVDCRLATKG